MLAILDREAPPVAVASPVRALSAHVATRDDPRVERTRLPPLLAVVPVARGAVVCGAETGDDRAGFGEAKIAWLRTFLDLPHGIPSHDTFNRVFAALDPTQFRACFSGWLAAVAAVLPPEVIALDGKTVRGSRDWARGKAAIPLLSAWASANRLILAQIKGGDTSNAISALPERLRALALAGGIVTVDALGCQREIARRISEAGGDDVLARKGNQGTLGNDVVDRFTHAQAGPIEALVVDASRTVGMGHGRIAVRRYRVITDADALAWLQDGHPWPGLRAMGMVEAERRSGETRRRERRYSPLRAPLPAKAFGHAVRSHWGIANQGHGVLDVAFHEDQSRIRAGHAAEHFAVLRHLALNLLQQHPSKRVSIKGKRLRAAWDNAFLLDVLGAI
jgi:predicted transposase YbfD/YdcC